MSLIKAIKAQLGLSNTPANNFTLDASADNGTLKLARGNAGATTQDILTVDAAGKVAATQGLLGFDYSLATNGYIKFPSWCFGGLIIQWGTDPGGSTDRNVAYPIAFPTQVFSVTATMVSGGIANSEVQGVGLGNTTVLSFFSVYPRFQTTGGGSGVASQPINWIAIGR